MNLLIANVLETTRAINPGPLPFNLSPAAGLFDATLDGGRPRVACPRREWFSAGFVAALVLVAMCALFLMPGTARAAIMAVTENHAGGRITLTDTRSERCTEHSFLAYTSGPGGEGTIFGCWVLDDSAETVFILWLDDNTIQNYAASLFLVRQPSQSTVDYR